MLINKKLIKLYNHWEYFILNFFKQICDYKCHIESLNGHKLSLEHINGQLQACVDVSIKLWIMTVIFNPP